MQASITCRGSPIWKASTSPVRLYLPPVWQSYRKHFPNCESISEKDLIMNSQIRALLLASLVLAGWLAFVPSQAKSQYGYNGYVARSAVNQYLNGYGGYGAYGSYSY